MIIRDMIFHAAVQLAPWQPLQIGSVIVSYLGPNTVLPLASVLAAGIGVVLMFWRYILAIGRRGFRTVFKRSEASSATVSNPRDEAGS
jgi:hypothetical protein